MSDPLVNASPTVSIAMCTYNAERFVGQQLDSFLRQTRLPDELVIQDDASTDRTRELVADFASRAPFPVGLEQNPSRLGPTGNFERAMARCSGDILLFSDADDVWLPNRIAEALRALVARPTVGVVFTDAELVDEALRPRGMTLWASIGFTPEAQARVTGGVLTEAFFRRTIGFGGSMAVRRAVVEAALPIGRPWGHDNWTAIIAAALFDVVILPKPLILYRQHGTQYSGGARAGLMKRIARARTPQPERDWVPRGSSYVELARRLGALEARALEPARLRRCLSDANAKAEHQMMRESLASGLFGRAVPVLRDLVRHRYAKYSNGALSAARDLAFGRY